MAFHEEHHYDTFRKLTDALQHAKSAYKSAAHKDRHTLSFYYPILVLQGQMFEVKQSGIDVAIEPTEHVRFRHSTYSGDRGVTCQIDVVTEAYFPQLLDVLGRTEQEVLARMRAKVGLERQVSKGEFSSQD